MRLISMMISSPGEVWQGKKNDERVWNGVELNAFERAFGDQVSDSSLGLHGIRRFLFLLVLMEGRGGKKESFV